MQYFEQISRAGTGLIIVVLAAVANYYGTEIDESALTELLSSVFALIGIAMTIWGQLKRKDLDYGIFRKEVQ